MFLTDIRNGERDMLMGGKGAGWYRNSKHKVKWKNGRLNSSVPHEHGVCQPVCYIDAVFFVSGKKCDNYVHAWLDKKMYFRAIR